jgi:hypothetical protein
MVRTVILVGGLIAALLVLILPQTAQPLGYGPLPCPQPQLSVCQPVVASSPCCVPSPIFPPPPHLVAPVIAAPRPMTLLPAMHGHGVPGGLAYQPAPPPPGYVPMSPPGPVPFPRDTAAPKPARMQPGIAR